MLGDAIVAASRETLTDELRALIRTHKAALLEELSVEVEARRARAESRLRADETLRVAFDVASAPLITYPGEPVSVMLAVRTPCGIVSAELHIPRERWDPDLFLRTVSDTAGRPQ